ncbi:MAG: hypothetical protein E7089_08835 [Bacteroidales bacterium]|nr:hypothetical protein [Bacteroidales bacterium]
MPVLEYFKLFKKTVLELGFENIKQQTFRWYINPFLYVDIEFRAQYLLYTCYTKIGKHNEPLASLEYKQIIYMAEDLLWCDKYYIKKVIQSMFAKMTTDHIDLTWGTVIMK